MTTPPAPELHDVVQIRSTPAIEAALAEQMRASQNLLRGEGVAAAQRFGVFGLIVCCG